MTELLSDASALRAAWERLLKEHHHLHGPQAAALLGVPEAAMMASRLGHGATELDGGLVALMCNPQAPIQTWGKVLMAIANPLGVALAIQQVETAQATEAGVLLDGSDFSALFHATGIANLYLFEQEDAHGRTVSLNWFDGRGDVLGRLFLMSKNGRDIALPFLLGHARPTPPNDRFWRPGPAASTQPIAVEGLRRGDQKAGSAEAPGLMRSTVLAVAGSPGTQVCMTGSGGLLDYRGPLSKTFEAGGGVHATDSGCKLHLQPTRATQAWQCTRVQADGARLEGLSFEAASGGSLEIVAPAQGVSQLRSQ